MTLLRDAGATEVHVRVSAPPFISPCYYGTDIDSKENLIACQMSEQEICRVIGADSLGYLSVEGVRHIADGRPLRLLLRLFYRGIPGGNAEGNGQIQI